MISYSTNSESFVSPDESKWLLMVLKSLIEQRCAGL